MPVTRVPGDGRKKLAMLKEVATLRAEAGWFEGNKYKDGTPVAYVAAIQETGYEHIPPHSFMRTTVNEKSVEWNSTMAKLLKNMDDAQSIMELIGGVVAGDIRAKIASIYEPPLSKRTIAARKKRGNSSIKPLVDLRILMPTLTHQVK